MKQFYSILLFSVLLLAWSVPVPAQGVVLPQSVTSAIPDGCEESRNSTWHTDYCNCYYNNTRFTSLPLDVTLSDTTWYKGSVNNFLSGMTAFIYGDCAVYVELYMNCKTQKARESIEILPNQMRDVDASYIQDALDSLGLSGISSALYLCIYPVEQGTTCRLFCCPYNEGPASTCADVLPLLPGMTLVSSHANDVYVLEHENIPDVSEATVEWFRSTADCHLRITRGSCNGDELLNAELSSSYALAPSLLNDARLQGEDLYFHFSHAKGSVGRVRLTMKEYIPSAVDNTSLPQVDSRLILTADGQLLILRGTERYTLTGAKL